MKPFQVPLIGQKQLTADLPSGKKKEASRTTETGHPPLPFSLALQTEFFNSSFLASKHNANVALWQLWVQGSGSLLKLFNLWCLWLNVQQIHQKHFYGIQIKQSNTFLSRISFPDFLTLLEILIITVKASLFPLKGTMFINLSISLWSSSWGSQQKPATLLI